MTETIQSNESRAKRGLTLMKKRHISLVILLGAAWSAKAADLPQDKPRPLTPLPTLASCASLTEFITTSCPLTYYGVTLYGTVDMGVAWQSHGVPFNPAYPGGIEELISKNSNKSLWSRAPNGLGPSNIGIKGTEEFAPGWSFVFNLQAGFDPYSMQLLNGPRSLLMNNGLPLAAQTSNGDSGRAGQFYNGLGYAGVSSSTFGTLTAGRQNSLLSDNIAEYDPMSAAYAFSVIGYSGAAGGTGDTESGKYTTSLKYRVDVGMFRAAALYQFGGYEWGNGSRDAYQFQVGADYAVAGGKFSMDALYSHLDGAVSLASLTAAQDLKFPGTLAATISDNTAGMITAKYARGPFKVFAGTRRYISPIQAILS
jgi:predicted porin